MDWLGAGIDGPLVVIRTIHFAATAITTGTLIFRVVAAEVASGSATPAGTIARAQTLRLAWICLAISVASGVIWLLSVAVSVSGLSFSESMNSEVLLTVVNETQFGLVAQIRFVMAVMMAGCLAYDRFFSARGLGAGLSVGLIGAIAWTGHAGSTTGELGVLHLAADSLHIVAAAIWLGGLVSLVLLLSAAGRDRSDAGLSFARDATRNFSTMGTAIVVVVFATGVVNAWILVGSLHALVATGYGRLLMLKMALFAVMLSFAAVNRFWLTPRLAMPTWNEMRGDSLRRLTRNSTIEIALALMIFAIVGILGTLHPAIHVFASHELMQ
jgi:putative copper resistance protein D